MKKYIITTYCDKSKVEVGNKAFTLFRLKDKFNIPPFFSITSDITKNILCEIEDEIKNHAKLIGNGPYAVRSSAVDEDGANASYAGQFQTKLNIQDDCLLSAVIEVLDSSKEESLIKYRESVGGTIETTIKTAILIQQMIKPLYSGIAFSKDPTGKKCITIVMTEGLGDKLASGEINGNTYFFNKNMEILDSIIEKKIDQLNSNILKEIAKLAIDCEKYFNYPQDIEWAVDQNQELFLLQSRPITTLKNLQKYIWDNSNIVESYSGIVSPLTFSFAKTCYYGVYKSFAKLIGISEQKILENSDVYENTLGYIDGRVYYNLLNWYKMLTMMPGFSYTSKYMEGMMGVSKALDEEELNEIKNQFIYKSKMFGFLNLSFSFIKLLYNFFFIKHKTRKFYERTNLVLEKVNFNEFDTLSLDELIKIYRSLQNTITPNWDAPIINDVLCMIFFAISRKALKNFCGEYGELLHNDFMIGQGDIISAEPVIRIKKIADLVRGNDELMNALANKDVDKIYKHKELKCMIQDYINTFGDRCFQELKLESPTLRDNPNALFQCIYSLALNQKKDLERSSNIDISFKLNSIIQNPIKRFLAKKLLDIAKYAVKNRENLRFERTKTFGITRKIFVAIGKKFVTRNLIETSSDIFFLKVEEILGLVEGTNINGDIKKIITLRKNDFKNFETRNPPQRFVVVDGLYPSNYNIVIENENLSQNSDDTLKGIGCCTGIVQGTVRVIVNPNNETLEKNEILVAKHTDPGWITAFINASGILVERGSLLSHSAIVSRELGIPSIVSIPNLTSTLKTGDIVEMNGSTGFIKVLSRRDLKSSNIQKNIQEVC